MGETAEQQAPASAPAAPPPLTHAQVAHDVFGSDFHGEVGKAEPEEKAPPPEDAHEGGAPVEEPAEGEPGETGEPEEETAPEDTGEMPIATVSELVEHLEENLGGELPPEWFNGLKMSFNVDGMPTEATIKELVDSYQLTDAARHRLETAKSIAQKEQETWAVKQQQLDGQFQVLAELVHAQEQTLERDVRAVDPSLRDTDPAEWGARQLEFGQRRAHIEQVKATARDKYIANAEAVKADNETRKAQYKAEQYNALLEKMPEFRDPVRAEAENRRVAEYAYRQGFSAEQYDNTLDHRQWLILRKAMLYDETRGKVDIAAKRVAKVPRIMKPGAPKPTEQLASEKLQKLRSKLENSGSIDDAVAYRLAKRGARR